MSSPSGEGLLQRAPEGVPEVIFGVIFEVIFRVILDIVGAIKSRFRVDGARVTELINAFVNYGFFACFSFAFSHFSHFCACCIDHFALPGLPGGGVKRMTESALRTRAT